MGELAEYIDGLPNLCGSEQRIEAAIRAGREQPSEVWPKADGFAKGRHWGGLGCLSACASPST